MLVFAIEELAFLGEELNRLDSVRLDACMARPSACGVRWPKYHAIATLEDARSSMIIDLYRIW